MGKSESESKWWIYFTVAINRKGATMTLEGEDESNGSGQPGLRQILIDASDKCIVALLRVGSTDRGGSKRSKFIYIQYCGNDVGVMKKAKFPMAISKLSPAFSAKAVSYQCDTEDVKDGAIDPKTILKDLLKAGGAHKPDHYMFGE